MRRGVSYHAENLRYERTAERQGYRAGHYEREFQTTSGNVTLKMPKLKGVAFETAIIERYQRRESSVEEALIEMYLAYFMANDDEKALLEKVFDIIALKISELEHTQVKNYARTMVGIDLSLQIDKWITEKQLTLQNYTNEQMAEMLISFFLETHTLKKATEFFADICKMWLDGCSFVEMHERTSIAIADLEDICSKSISYELSFFMGNVIDIIEINDEDIANPLPNLLLLQRRMKYGVRNETAVSLCEKVFNDRFLANLLAEELGNDAIRPFSIVENIKLHRDSILKILSPYPKCFSQRIKWICKG